MRGGVPVDAGRFQGRVARFHGGFFRLGVAPRRITAMLFRFGAVPFDLGAVFFVFAATLCRVTAVFFRVAAVSFDLSATLCHAAAVLFRLAASLAPLAMMPGGGSAAGALRCLAAEQMALQPHRAARR